MGIDQIIEADGNMIDHPNRIGMDISKSAVSPRAKAVNASKTKSCFSRL